jgi:hypothetical protein
MAKITNPLAITNMAEVAAIPSPDEDERLYELIDKDLQAGPISPISPKSPKQICPVKTSDLETVIVEPMFPPKTTQLPKPEEAQVNYFQNAAHGVFQNLSKILESKEPFAEIKQDSDFEFLLYNLSQQDKAWTPERLCDALDGLYESGALDEFIPADKPGRLEKIAEKYRNSGLAKALAKASGKVSKIKDSFLEKYPNPDFITKYVRELKGILADKKQARELLKMQMKSSEQSIWSSWKKQERELLKTDGESWTEYVDFLDILHDFGYKSEAAVKRAYDTNPNDPKLKELENCLLQYNLCIGDWTRSDNPLIRSKQILCEASFKNKKKEPNKETLEGSLFAEKVGKSFQKLSREFGESISGLDVLTSREFTSYKSELCPVEDKIYGATGCFGSGIEALFVPNLEKLKQTINYIYSGGIKKDIRASLNHLENWEYNQLEKELHENIKNCENKEPVPCELLLDRETVKSAHQYLKQCKKEVKQNINEKKRLLEQQRLKENRKWILENCGPLAKEYVQRWEAYEAILEAREASLVEASDLLEKAGMKAEGTYKRFSKSDKSWTEYCTNAMSKIFKPIQDEAFLLQEELNKLEDNVTRYYKGVQEYNAQVVATLANLNLVKDSAKDRERFAKIMLEDRVEDAQRALKKGLAKKKEEVAVYNDSIAIAKLAKLDGKEISAKKIEKSYDTEAYLSALKLAENLEIARKNLLDKKPAYVAENFLKQMYALNNLGVDQIADLENALEDVKESGSRGCTLVYSPVGYRGLGKTMVPTIPFDLPFDARVEADEKDCFSIKYRKTNGKTFTYKVENGEIYAKGEKICESCLAKKGMTKQTLIDYWNADKTKLNSTIIANNAVYALALAYKNS